MVDKTQDLNGFVNPFVYNDFMHHYSREDRELLERLD